MMLIRTAGESVKFIGSKYIQESLINTTPNRPDYFLFFLQESQAKALTNQSKHLFQNKNKRPRCIKVGNGPLKSLCEKYCNYLLTTTQSDRFASCEHFVSLSQTSSTPPWNKPVLDIPKSERSIVYRIRKWPMDSKLKIIIYCLSWWTSHDFLYFFFCFFWDWLFRKGGSRVFLSQAVSWQNR